MFKTLALTATAGLAAAYGYKAPSAKYLTKRSVGHRLGYGAGVYGTRTAEQLIGKVDMRTRKIRHGAELFNLPTAYDLTGGKYKRGGYMKFTGNRKGYGRPVPASADRYNDYSKGSKSYSGYGLDKRLNIGYSGKSNGYPAPDSTVFDEYNEVHRDGGWSHTLADRAHSYMGTAGTIEEGHGHAPEPKGHGHGHDHGPKNKKGDFAVFDEYNEVHRDGGWSHTTADAAHKIFGGAGTVERGGHGHGHGHAHEERGHGHGHHEPENKHGDSAVFDEWKGGHQDKGFSHELADVAHKFMGNAGTKEGEHIQLPGGYYGGYDRSAKYSYSYPKQRKYIQPPSPRNYLPKTDPYKYSQNPGYGSVSHSHGHAPAPTNYGIDIAYSQGLKYKSSPYDPRTSQYTYSQTPGYGYRKY